MLSKQAFMLILYKRSKHLYDLLKVLEDSGGTVFIHIDAKANDNKLIELINSFSNTIIIPEHYKISWGGFNMVKAMIALLENAFSFNEKFGHFIFLSGSDYPVFNGEGINAFFDKFSGKELISAYSITNNTCKHCESKVTKYFFMDGSNCLFSKAINCVCSELFRGFKKHDFLISNKKIENVFYGSQWFAITSKCVNYVLKQVHSRKYVNYFRHAFAPDELFFHTIIFNSSFCDQTFKGGPTIYSPTWDLFNYTYLESNELNCKNDEIESSRIRSKIKFLRGKITFPENVGDGSIIFLNDKYYVNIINSGLPFCRKVDDISSKKLIRKLRLINGLSSK